MLIIFFQPWISYQYKRINQYQIQFFLKKSQPVQYIWNQKLNLIMINIHTVSFSASWNCLSSRRIWICRASGTACRHHTWLTDATYTRPWRQRTTSLGFGTVTDWMNKQGSTVRISTQSASKANRYGSS